MSDDAATKPCDASSCDDDCTCGNNLATLLMAMAQARANQTTKSAGLNAAIDAMEKPAEDNTTRTKIAPTIRFDRIVKQAIKAIEEQFHNRSNSFAGVASLTQDEVDAVLFEFNIQFPGRLAVSDGGGRHAPTVPAAHAPRSPGAVFIAYCEPDATPDDNGCKAFTIVGKW